MVSREGKKTWQWKHGIVAQQEWKVGEGNACTVKKSFCGVLIKKKGGGVEGEREKAGLYAKCWK